MQKSSSINKSKHTAFEPILRAFTQTSDWFSSLLVFAPDVKIDDRLGLRHLKGSHFVIISKDKRLTALEHPHYMTNRTPWNSLTVRNTVLRMRTIIYMYEVVFLIDTELITPSANYCVKKNRGKRKG